MTWLPRKTVLVPVDFSDESLAALETASELTEDASDLNVIHVLPVLEPAEPGIIWQTIDDASRGQHAEAALGKALAEAGYTGVKITIEFGDPGYEIARHAEEISADLVVIPSHGRSGITRILLGSVTERVVRLAHCPVLVLKK